MLIHDELEGILYYELEGVHFIGSLLITSWVVLLASWDLGGACFVNFLV